MCYRQGYCGDFFVILAPDTKLPIYLLTYYYFLNYLFNTPKQQRAKSKHNIQYNAKNTTTNCYK